MPKCPSCDAVLEQDFGMVTCPGCQSVLMIDISGQVQMASDEPDSYEGDDDFEEFSADDSTDDFENTTDDTDLESDQFAEDQSFGDNDNFEDENNWDDSSQSASGEKDDFSDTDQNEDFENFDEDESLDNLSEEDQEANPAFGHFADDNQNDDDNFQEDPLDTADEIESQPEVEMAAEPVSSNDPIDQGGVSSFDEEEESPEQFPVAQQADSTPVDVTEFANSEESSLEEGELMYDIFISRIDSKDLRDEVKFVLMDEKLKLNHGEFIKKIKGGKLTVPDLNPIKAKRVVEQLQYSDLDIKWKQKRVIIETVEPEEDFDEGEGIAGEEADL